MRFLQDGTPVANLALAYNYGRKGDDGKRPTTWVQASLWGKRAEALAPHLIKGTAIVAYMTDVHVRTFQKQDGTQGAALNARLDNLEFAGGGQRENAPQNAPGTHQPSPGYGGNQYRQASGGNAPPQQQAAPSADPGFDDNLDNFIPF